MDVLLATPIKKTHYSVPPLGLGYLASALRKAGILDVCVLDPVKEKMDQEDFRTYLQSHNPKIIGLQCFSLDVGSVGQMLRIAKQSNPAVITVIGGPHPTAVAAEVFDTFGTSLDFAVLGEGEKAFTLLAQIILGQRHDLHDVPGLVYRKGEAIACNKIEHIKDLDALEMPAWDLINPATYSDEAPGVVNKGFPIAPIVTSRGCPHECTFCANSISMGRVIRFRDIEKVLDEMEHLVTRYGVKEFHVSDDNFTVNKKRVIDFCQRIKERGLKVFLSFPNGVRIDTLDEPTLLALKEAGAYSITVAIESGSQRILDHMRKKLDLQLIQEKTRLIKRLGFKISAFFILGYPAETKEDIMKTVSFSKSLPIDIAHFSCFLPLPGTRITQELINSGKLKAVNYEDLVYSKAVFSPDGITTAELKIFQRNAFLSFYLRPRIFLGLISRLKSPKNVLTIFKRTAEYILKGES